ncbi:Amino-acid acetyltransferase,mitochondrial5 / FY16936)) [Taphrina deformans PYCC 5710]|uniref:Amino-acid acetyltransferase, mitochondrial n=1 Tax=Taphrina deformans (strain PYCC 5710 / ATCC 11124 / CBS 356.35 / IMI 108563 / JCM 9778 / NBRC 8474) TaxID=1097556 RepID=R4X8B8_TAPDE|nr:Amino-acid acetyltransferase,mitochondrial5 / FY16936)) [Taphrina deformans PYCC 5710]|eukprot:CCG81517.1 Amino-acid acetyltransferase,mitochondrial5 / FY16936)) [Taphrina deformans PYCC 5710]
MQSTRRFCNAAGHVRHIVTHHKPSYAETQLNRTFFLTVLAATATKRDAKAYIEKYQKPYSKARAIKVKESQSLSEFFEADDGELIDVEPPLVTSSPIRVALITIRDMPDATTEQLTRIADTLAQLHRLGLQPVVIVDSGKEESATGQSKQVERLTSILHSIDLEARPISEGLFDLRIDPSVHKTMHKKRIVSLYDTRTLKAPVCRRQIPVIRTLAVDQWGKKTTITADSAMKALCKAFGNKPATVPFQKDLNRSALIIDKLIIIDKVGGILSPQRKKGSHVFINLDQEALQLQRELATLSSPDIADRHLRNLDTCQVCLDLLTDSASAVVTTPDIAGSVPGTQHPLIYNLLTDKPMFSPSLPVSGSRTPTTVTTILRKGVSVTIHRHISLRSPEINLTKLVSLIDDSFGRRLDVEGYLARLGDTVEAVIVAGDYEGAAIVTSEHPTTATSAAGSSPAVPYLDKFAVLRARQGAGGVADVLFNAMMRQFPHELTWRSRDENPVNKWYFERAKGTFVIPSTASGKSAVRWRLFWTQAPSTQARFEEYIDVASKIQPTWLD